jgi:hypothetical protein
VLRGAAGNPAGDGRVALVVAVAGLRVALKIADILRRMDALPLSSSCSPTGARTQTGFVRV